MVHTLWAQVVHGFMYVVMACMAYLLVSPKHKFHPKKQLIAYIGVSSLVIAIYLTVERPDPVLFALYMTPICLALAIFYYRWIASLFCILVMAGSSIIILGNAWEPVLASTALLMGAGLFLMSRLPIYSLSSMSIYTLLGTSLYLGTYLGVERALYRTVAASREELLIYVPAALLSSLMVAFLSFFVKNQIHLQKKLNLSEKYQTIGQLAASISHEIRNPLTTTRGFLQLMNYDKLTKENFERYRKHAFEGLDHANRIITDYLNFSKPNKETAKPLHVADEIEGVVKWLEPYAVQLNVSIVTHHLGDEPLYVHVESKQFQQCMLNLMKNAVEAMVADGGLLTVHTRADGEQAQILIRDTGIGMDQEQLKQIGMPYFSTKETGTGLGLMVVMSLIKSMNGKIMFRSKRNQGTICEIQFNRYRPARETDRNH